MALRAPYTPAGPALLGDNRVEAKLPQAPPGHQRLRSPLKRPLISKAKRGRAKALPVPAANRTAPPQALRRRRLALQIKHDGFRVIAIRDGGRTRLFMGNGYENFRQAPEHYRPVERAARKTVGIDDELVISRKRQRASGRSSIIVPRPHLPVLVATVRAAFPPLS